MSPDALSSSEHCRSGLLLICLSGGFSRPALPEGFPRLVVVGVSFGSVIERWLLESLGIWWADCILTYVRIHIFFFLSFGYDVATSLITYVSLESEVGEQKT